MAGIGLYGGDPVGNIAVTEQGLDAVPTSTGEYQAAKLSQGFAANPTPRSIRSIERMGAETGMIGVSDEYGNPVTIAPEPPMEAEAANTEFGIPGVLKFDKPTPRSVAQDLYDHHRDELLRQNVINRNEGGIATGALGLGANLFAGTMDPMNLAVGFIPIAGEVRVAALLKQAGGAAGRAAIRAGLGGAQGAVAMAALQPIEYVLSRGEQEDYTMAQALRSIALGTLIGGGMHATIGAGIDRYTGKYRNPLTQGLEESGPDAREGILQGALGQFADGRPVDTTAVLPLADAYRAEQNLGMYIRRQQQLTAEGDRTVASAATAEDRALAAKAGIDGSAQRLDDLRSEAERTRAELEAARGRGAAEAAPDTVTPERLNEIEWEMAQPGLAAARRAELEAERTMLTEGAREPTDLEAGRTAAEVTGLEATLRRQQRAVTGAEAALQRQQAAPATPTGFDANVDRLASQQQVLQATTERELRRVAGKLGIGLPPAEVTAMAQRILAATPDEARDVIWPILGDIASRRTEMLPPLEGGIAGDVAQRLIAAGRPEAEARAYGLLQQRLFEAHAAQFEGAKGSAEDIYRREGPGLLRDAAASTLKQGELAQRGVTDTVKTDNAIQSARTDQGQALPGRVPTGKNAPANRHTDADAIPDLATLESNPELFAKNVDAIGADPGLGHNGGPPLNSGLPRTFASPHEKAEYLIGRLMDNLRWLYNQVPAQIRDRSRLWYDGAQAISTEWGDRWGLTRSQTAGILAVLSPQKDWFMNTSMAERVGDIIHRFIDHRWDGAMDAQVFKFLLGETMTSVENRAAYDAIKEKTLREVIAAGNPVETGIWIRAYDEAHHGPAHAIITPEGAYAGNKLTAAGEEARLAWQDFGAIGKAVSIFMDGSPENISRQLGGFHKVRNFYNNIFNASDPRYITIDTHAVAASELRPLASKDKAVLENFRATGTDRATGIMGSYPLHAEAYRRLAEEFGILPRELQSITWEAVRGLFPDSWKTAVNKLAVDAIWDRVGIGELSAEDARLQIHALASGASKEAIDAVWARIGEGEGKISIADARAQISALTTDITPPDWVGHDAASMVDRTSTYGMRGPSRGAVINFEVAPDPRNPAVVARWRAVPQDVRDRISHSVAWNTAKSALEGVGEALWGRAGKKQLPIALKASLHRNNGGWLDDSNPSLSLLFDQNIAPAKVGIVARLMGYALRQEETLHTSPKTFPSGKETGQIVIDLPRDATPAQIHEVYQQIRELKNEAGESYVIGHTTGDNRIMEILNNNGRATIGTTELIHLIDEKLGGKYDIREGIIHAERVEAGRNDYALSGQVQRRRAGEAQSDWILRRAANNLRAAAQRHLEDELLAHERSVGTEPRPAGEPGAAGEPRVAGEPGAPRGPPAELEQAFEGRRDAQLNAEDRDLIQQINAGNRLSRLETMQAFRDKELWRAETPEQYLNRTSRDLSEEQRQRFIREANDMDARGEQWRQPPTEEELLHQTIDLKDYLVANDNVPRAAATELEQAGRGKIRLATDDARSLITLLENADASTYGHEALGHDWVERLLRDAADPQAPPQLVADAATTRRELGGKEGEPLTTEQHEQFAQWFEQYLREGVAPTPELKSVFEQFREWLVEIYQTITELGLPLTDNMRGVFDRMLTVPERERLAAARPGERPIAEVTPGTVGAPRLPGRAPAAGEPGGPRPTDTLAEIHAQATELERLQQAMAPPARAGEVRPEAQAAADATAELAAEAEARASALERAAFCISRG